MVLFFVFFFQSVAKKRADFALYETLVKLEVLDENKFVFLLVIIIILCL